MTEPATVIWVESSPFRASPKSMIFTMPPGVSMMFAGLMSRWTMRASCACSMPAHMSLMSCSAISIGGVPNCSIHFLRSSPSTNSMAMYATSSCRPQSITCTMFGWRSIAAARASRSKRWTSFSSSARCG